MIRESIRLFLSQVSLAKYFSKLDIDELDLHGH